jgi:hypothetical protein
MKQLLQNANMNVECHFCGLNEIGFNMYERKLINSEHKELTYIDSVQSSVWRLPKF